MECVEQDEKQWILDTNSYIKVKKKFLKQDEFINKI